MSTNSESTTASEVNSDTLVDVRLDDLRNFINRFLDSVASAERENHEQVQARIAEAAEATERVAGDLKVKSDAATAAVTSHWQSFTDALSAKKAEVYAQITERAQERDVRRAQEAADKAERIADDSVSVARIAIQNAWVAVLDAIDAALYAKDLTDPSATPVGKDA